MTVSQNHSNISATIKSLRQQTQCDVQKTWQIVDRACEITELPPQGSVPNELNEKGYLVWEKGRVDRWFYQDFQIPAALAEYPLAGLTLRLALTWWAELAEVFINDQKVQEGDLFDHSCRLVLSESARSGEVIRVAIRLVSPGHDIGGLMKSRLVYESKYDTIDPGFVADELAVIESFANTFAIDELTSVETAVNTIDWSVVSDRPAFDRSLQQLRDRLLPWSDRIKQHRISMVGHAHLDLAWLWDIAETWDAAERTFRSVLNLQKDFPDLTFCHSTPVLYEWMEQHRPELFAEIQTRAKEGRWEVVGGLWVEPEMNLIGAESIARQILYGQRYYQEKFGAINRIAWLPDTFGFNWQLPQFLKQGGIDYFVTQKFRWNDTNRYDHEIFDWRSPDGTTVCSYMSGPIGEGIDPVKLADYAWDWTSRTGKTESLWLPGVGDHGGGPTRDMLEVGKRWATSPFFPTLQFTTAIDYLDQLAEDCDRPVHNDELYLEFHRGCYTTHGDQKAFNRSCEALLYQAEYWSSLATIAIDEPYPKQELEVAWKKVLFNQFHDILPGTSIQSVFVEVNETWKAAEMLSRDLRDRALNAIATHVTLPPNELPNAQSIVVFNPCNWTRSIHGYDIPANGYRALWIAETEAEEPIEGFVLENDRFTVAIDSTTGDIASFFDKQQQREILRDRANQLQAFKDDGQYWDAWNIDPKYADHPLESSTLNKIDRIDRQTIVVTRTLLNSIFEHRYTLQDDFLQIDTTVNWQDRHVVVKAAFPVAIEAESVTYEIPAGAIDRPTVPQTAAEKAKWEVSALGWADISDREHGMSLLSTCKHGYDAQPNQIRLTLLRGSEFPDPIADLGIHHFTYAIYPHAGSWQTAKTVQKAIELSQPLEVVAIDRTDATLPTERSFFSIVPDSFIAIALKAAEDQQNWILRGYESCGEVAAFQFESDDLQWGESVDLLERSISTSEQIQPWQIRSYRLAKK